MVDLSLEHRAFALELVGSITPIGEPFIDRERLDNLALLMNVIEWLLSEVDDVITSNKNRTKQEEIFGYSAASHLSNIADFPN